MKMSRYAPYLGVVAALAVFVLFVSHVPSTRVYESAPPLVLAPVGSSTLAVVTQTVATTAVAQPLAPIKPDPFVGAASILREALVNIICFAPSTSGTHSVSGSGVIVSPTGIIITNAHIAQYYLLANDGVTCDVRTGSPATSTYKAMLAYLPPAWIEDNASLITQHMPRGTGERDFALLAISNPPQGLAYVSLATKEPRRDQEVSIASYAAQNLSPDQVRSGFYPTVVLSTIKDVLTFKANTPDVLEFVGSLAAQEGSSGGGVVDSHARLLGIISTSKVFGDVADRTLRAISTSYIRREYERETGQHFESALATPGSTLVELFAPRVAPLRTILEDAIRHQ
ncbi:hypothetical protein COU19_03440 [Candidatus Kaiserbacteria bacterium CG10_big_fil_rev_8_21_14_0_10_56_12]|uniref:Serine protease n=1 Tax=Candidatus Kaiserbacteria bacterium CG10_big_fil_rev_8_21_14_0_10_56_12 TaxID=1974611 RepID=A0A2H0U8Z2_9BACT|nr:MAG: hypothetical protein COU19_03440 [Candidatus Kaiserbacteria bacterium CG10_big_fil_rev_8_21_14_0_10_56_12]